MTDATAPEEVKKPSKTPLILGVFLAVVGGGGGFYAVYSGMLLGGESPVAQSTDDSAPLADQAGEKGAQLGAAVPMGDTAFVPLDPLVISLAPGSGSRHLRFRAQLEVPASKEREVSALLPRVVDVLNSYLRAVEPRDFEDPAILSRLRAQMLRRVQIVTGADRVRDLLIMEFVLN
ncbi:flagellar basal body-associated FliL family protein [Lacimonas salitolerans]|uniref:Flagellar protein FliL n=1 Tax=Lacimonas salitolerans TaxID=1323750 RepID=A0ABW4EJE6_9RHOB